MSRIRYLLTLVVVLSVLTSGVTSAAGDRVEPASPETDADTRATVAAIGDSQAYSDVDEGDASISGGDITVTRGDEVTITVSHSDPATLTIGGEDYGFNVTVDLGGSGTSEVVLDTRRTTAADAGEFIEGGSATLHSKPLDEPMKPARYPLSVDIDGVERDVTILNVEARAEMSGESYRAPSSFEPTEHLGEGEDGDAAVDPLQEVMIAGTNVTRRDYAVAKFEESGLETALNPDNLTGTSASNGLKISVKQERGHPNENALEYVATESSRVTVLPNFADDEIYVVWNTRGLEVASRPDRNRYHATITLTAKSGFVEEETTLATTEFDLRASTMSLSPVNDSVHYPWDNETFAVEGRTNRVPGTPLEVRLRGYEANSFLELGNATVDSNGSFESSLNVSSVPRGTNATLWVYNHSSQTSQRIYLVAPDPEVTIADQTANGTTVTIERAEIPEGGFVYLEDADGESIGRSDYLEPGEYTNVTAELSTPLFESQPVRVEMRRAGEDQSYDPDADPYVYSGNDSVVNDTADVAFPQAPTETASPTATATPTPTATPYPVVTRTALAPSGASESSLPLSPAVAIVALLGVGAFLARRR
ncbi:DUF7282 domain-containing protein [Halobellus rarus]|uniref:BGTF surface domain-containing protein n=1 Tax=Halobellus rarus TaxID=1126237 RepID=A0ABD6CKA3_9EURY|nr:BGTF surface domain-containing protein [Halobellus rarus]